MKKHIRMQKLYPLAEIVSRIVSQRQTMMLKLNFEIRYDSLANEPANPPVSHRCFLDQQDAKA